MEKNIALTEHTAIKQGQIINDIKNGFQYRILWLRDDVVSVCRIDCSALKIILMPINTIISKSNTEDFVIIEDTPQVVDISTLSNSVKEKYQKYISFMRKIESVYGPDFLSLMGHAEKPLINEFINESGYKRNAVWKMIKRYLKSGCSPASLVDERALRSIHLSSSEYSYVKKPGRKNSANVGILITDTEKQIFEKTLKHYKSRRTLSVHKSYIWMLKQYYTGKQFDPASNTIQFFPYPSSEVPSERQLQYYFDKKLTREDKAIIKTSRREVRNKMRLLKSDSLCNVFGPGDLVQIDECEIDLSLLSSVTDSQVIGRAIVYVMLDTFSKVCLAVGVAYDNNNIIGFTNCMLNLHDDKVALCKKYGIAINENQWPSNCIPNRIISDHGSEYMSEEAARICSELGIVKEMAPAAMGSLKGDVEQWFHQFQSYIRPYIEKNGMISTRHDSKPNENAILTYDNFMKLLLSYVQYYNNTEIENYHMDRQEIEAEMVPTPVNIWKYGCKMYGEPRKIQNENQYMYTLMLPVEATITRSGFALNGLNYADWKNTYLSEILVQDHRKNKKMTFRMDPRDIGSLYYIRNGTLFRVPLNNLKHGNADFAGLTLAEWLAVKHALYIAKKERKITKNQAEAYLSEMFDKIIDNAQDNFSGDRSTSNIRDYRRLDKMLVQSENNMFQHLSKYLIENVGEAPIEILTNQDSLLLEDSCDIMNSGVTAPMQESASTPELGSDEFNTSLLNAWSKADEKRYNP